MFEYNIAIFTSAMQEKRKCRFFHNRLFYLHVLLDKVGTRQHYCIHPPETDSKYSIGITRGRPTSHSYKLHQMHVCNIFYVSTFEWNLTVWQLICRVGVCRNTLYVSTCVSIYNASETRALYTQFGNHITVQAFRLFPHIHKF